MEKQNEPIAPVQQQAPVVTKKKSFFQMLKDDSIMAAKDVVERVALPAFKRMVFDTLVQGLRTVIFKDDPSVANSMYNTLYPFSTNTNYRSISNNVATCYNRTPQQQDRIYYTASNIYRTNVNGTMEIMKPMTEYECRNVLERLNDFINQYEFATISNLNSILGINGNFTDKNHDARIYGWTDLSQAVIIPSVGGGYRLQLPKVVLYSNR